MSHSRATIHRALSLRLIHLACEILPQQGEPRIQRHVQRDENVLSPGGGHVSSSKLRDKVILEDPSSFLTLHVHVHSR